MSERASATSAPAAATRHPDLIEQMAAVNAAVNRLDKAVAFEKIEAARAALALTRVLLDSIVVEVMELRGLLKQKESHDAKAGT